MPAHTRYSVPSVSSKAWSRGRLGAAAPMILSGSVHGAAWGSDKAEQVHGGRAELRQ